MARDCYDDCIAFLDEQLGRLLDELQGPGAPRQHRRDHHLGPWGSVRRSWHLRPLLHRQPRRDRRPAGDPLPGRAGGPRGVQPVSLRDLPATVVDLLGLSAGSPFPGRSLAAYWGLPAPGRVPRRSPPLPSPSRPIAPRSNRPAARPARQRPGSRCPWWPRVIITSATASGPSSSTI